MLMRYSEQMDRIIAKNFVDVLVGRPNTRHTTPPESIEALPAPCADKARASKHPLMLEFHVRY